MACNGQAHHTWWPPRHGPLNQGQTSANAVFPECKRSTGRAMQLSVTWMLGDAKSPCNLLVAGVHSSTRTRLHFEAGKNVESQKDKAVCDLWLCSWVNVCACVCICVYSLCVTCAPACRLQRARGVSVRSRRPAWLGASCCDSGAAHANAGLLQRWQWARLRLVSIVVVS